ncbi:DUF2795 domain-containing protein [Sciscionella marina]|uniref:DUF2795 domain-containing protein n=1 Tax=Sciscionella marina TaxID=508770 RepID=UPI00039CDF81|nr:DUF2795 domain-containing protein [Sciscionella marina]
MTDVDYPADKDELLARARLNEADTETVTALRTVQPVSYANFADVAGAVPMTEGQSDADKAEQDRQRTQDGLAESHTETPDHPIVEELGENRGS